MRLGAAAPRYPKGTNLRSVGANPPGARVSGCGGPYWAAARGRGTEKGYGPQTAPGGSSFAPGRDVRVLCVPVVKPRHPGAECVLRLRSGLENGKRLSGINQRNAFESLARRKG